jgi:prepilin-type N-terminal cleavage/methylation domain-containing protein
LRARRQRGFTLIEVIISMTIFGTLLVIVFALTAEMRRWEKRLPVNFMRHPQIMSVISRMRRDVLDVQVGTNGKIYLDEYTDQYDNKLYENTSKTLILQTLPETGLQTIIWDFTEPGVARRLSYNVGVRSEWVARGLPNGFSSGVFLEAVEFEGRPYGVRLKAEDSNGQISIDQILQPRTHE